jgi:hypothetical protein
VRRYQRGVAKFLNTTPKGMDQHELVYAAGAAAQETRTYSKAFFLLRVKDVHDNPQTVVAFIGPHKNDLNALLPATPAKTDGGDAYSGDRLR